MDKFKELNERVVNWADNKGILKKGTPLAQHGKTEEEVAEVREALFAQDNYLEYYKNSKGAFVTTIDEIKDGIGDVLVTLLIQCKMQNIDPLDCLELALNVIEKRKGKMVGGTFVKDNTDY
jgi:NTP pyrophosphatase (non-canonical NTP hydrolase)